MNFIGFSRLWKWMQFKWRVFFGVKLIGNLTTYAQMLVGISLVWVMLSRMLLFDVFLMEISMKEVAIVECIIRLLTVRMVFLGFLEYSLQFGRLKQRKQVQGQLGQQQQSKVVGTTPQSWVWSGKIGSRIGGRQIADFQGMIDLNVDQMDISQRIGFDIQMVGEHQCGLCCQMVKICSI
jgi:hypothetical protein